MPLYPPLVVNDSKLEGRYAPYMGTYFNLQNDLYEEGGEALLRQPIEPCKRLNGVPLVELVHGPNLGLHILAGAYSLADKTPLILEDDALTVLVRQGLSLFSQVFTLCRLFALPLLSVSQVITVLFSDNSYPAQDGAPP